MDPLPKSEPTPTDEPRSLVRRLLVHARCLGASLEDAEDLVHETVEQALAQPAWFDPSRGTLVGALKVVLRNRWFNRRRALEVRERHAPHLQLVPGPGPEAPLGAAEARENRRRLLASLEPDERALFAAWLRQRGGARASEVAHDLGFTEAA
ncbi:MAG: hypothetical protein ABMA64_34890, partial [Myxococcota bacterium]